MTLTKPGPVEVWLTQKNITVECMVVHEDESTVGLDIDSLSMRGAQREITGYLLGQGYTPVGRWSLQHDGEDGATEFSRTFKPAAAEPPADVPQTNGVKVKVVRPGGDDFRAAGDRMAERLAQKKP